MHLSTTSTTVSSVHFKVDATRYGNQRRAQASAKVEQRRRDRRTAKHYEDDE